MKIKTEFLEVTVTNGHYPGGIKLKDVAKDKLAEIAEAVPYAFEVAVPAKGGKMEEVGKGDL